MMRALIGVVVLFSLTVVPARAAEDEKALGLAAARADAFRNISKVLYEYPIKANVTFGSLVTSAKDRAEVDAVVRGVNVVEGPETDAQGIVRVVNDLDTLTLPYQVRMRMNLPRHLRADGIADIQGATKAKIVRPMDMPAQMKDWYEKTLTGVGKSQIEQRSDLEAAKADARQRAFLDALGTLAKELEKLPLEEGVTVGDWLREHGDARADFDAAIAQAAMTSEKLERGGLVYQAEVSLPASVVVRVMRLKPFDRPITMLSRQQIEIARKNAIDDARQLLKARIDKIELASKITVGEMLSKRKDMRAEVDKKLAATPIEKIEITSTGLVKAYASFATSDLPGELQRLLLVSTPARIYAIGGGLPIEKQKVEPAPPVQAPEPTPTTAPAGAAK